MASINGFSVVPYGSSLIGTYTIKGTGTKVNVRKEIAPILMGFAADFAKQVEALNPKTCGGHNPRYIAGTTQWSFHATGCAIDLNWDKHPMGRRNTFSAGQRTVIRNLLKKWSYKGRQLIRWGADFVNNPDDMHFEVIVDRATALLAVKALQTPTPPKPPAPVGHPKGSRELKAGMTGEDVKFVQTFIGPSRCGAADGVFGAKTTSGVKWYQGMRGITVNGKVDKGTWKQMGVKVTY